MTWHRRLWQKLRALVARPRMERELDEELRFHLEMRTEENRRRGMAPDEACTAAMRRFGGVNDIKEACRDARGVRPLEDLGRDLRHGLRLFRRNPSTAIVTVAILALGLSFSVAVYSLVQAYLLRPLPFPEPEELVWILRGPDRETMARPEGLETIPWDELSDVFAGTVAWDLDAFNLVGEAGPEVVDGAWVSPGFFETLGVEPALGRAFGERETRQGERVAVISHGLWQRRFGGDPAILGRSIRAASSDRPDEADVHTVIGVLPKDFWYFNRFTDMLLPLNQPERPPTLARLAPGVALQEAQARLDGVTAERVTNVEPGWHMALLSAHGEHVEQARPTLLALLGAVALVLLVSCANVGGLLAARAVHRWREVTVRAVLGAGRRRLLQQLLTEHLLMAVLAGVLGVALAAGTLDLLGQVLEEQLRVTVPGGVENLRLDGGVLAVGLGLTVLTGLLFGLLPALLTLRGDLESRLRDRSAAITGGAGSARWRGLLLVGQVALSFTLLVGAGLMIRTVGELARLELGFEPEGVTRAHLLLPRKDYTDTAARTQLFGQAVERLEGLPGVESAAVAFPHPFRGWGGRAVTPEGGNAETLALYHFVTPQYFSLLKIPHSGGRLFLSDDREESPPVVVLSDDLAARLWPGQDAVGKRLKLGGPDSDDPWRTVVGTVGPVRNWLDEPHLEEIYLPYDQVGWASMYFLVRTRPGTEIGQETFQQVISELDPTLPVDQVTTLPEMVHRAGAGQRFLSRVLIGFATFTVLLAALGLYSALSYSVSRRSREIAVRMALGAEPRQVARWVGGEGVRLVALGVALGILLSLLASRVLSGQLFGVEPTDPLAYAGVSAVMAATALLAILAPTRRAARLDPVAVLKEE